MKHLGETPPPPSELRPDVPHDLDLVVVRALAKEPAERYQSAAEMDADLETVARGGRVAAETAEAATMVLAGERDARRDRRSRGRPPAATAVRAAEARTPALAVAPRDRHGPRRARAGPALLRLDPAPARRARRRWPSRTSSGSSRRIAVKKIEEKGLTPQVRPRLELGRGGRRRLQPDPDGRHARRQGDRRHDRRLLGQAGGDDPERRRPDRRRRGRGAHASRARTRRSSRSTPTGTSAR